ncbi:hypothetical protein AB0K87_11030 [Streptomyces sp. NPDC053705]|jgi:hypothetical protein|uniref:hypothetical protein n=1 Tax=Streptomyces sp. NPDC053705 TaxID=3156668 RepID=UPI0034295B22
MKEGQELLLRGSAGAPFRVTVGQPFTREEIGKRLASGEWAYWEGQPPAPSVEETEQSTGEAEPTKAPAASVPDPDRPAANAPKAEWVIYIARTQHMSREDAANYTKADLIDMAS